MKNSISEIAINDIKIGDGSPCFITFEAGPTHRGFDSAKQLAKLAKEGGGDAIKFQMGDPTRLIADPDQPFTYQVLVDKENEITETVTEPLRDLFERRKMDQDEWRALKKYCDEIGLAFFATAFFHEDIDFLMEIGCQSIKVASADLNHLPLIKHAARTGVCVQLDTGMASIGEMEKAVDAIIAEGNDKIIIHHCPSGYPAHTESINLRAIPAIKKFYRCPVAFSDHSVGWDMDVAALAMGANLIEKTITEDRTIRSIEHVMSLEPWDLKKFVNVIRNVEIAMGVPRRVLSEVELQRRKDVRRSLHVLHDIPAGHTIIEDDIDYRRPGHGISPEHLQEVLSRTLVNGKVSGQRLEWSDLSQ